MLDYALEVPGLIFALAKHGGVGPFSMMLIRQGMKTGEWQLEL